jgi:hypothetical protein
LGCENKPQNYPFLKDFMSYLTYFNQNTGLSADFIPLDEQGNQIQRMYFESVNPKTIYTYSGGEEW